MATQILLDMPNTVITTSWSSGWISWNNFSNLEALGAYITITNVLGTSPTLDITLEESQDGWTTWKPIYQFPRVTGNTALNIEKTQLNGVRRWSWIVWGTTPSFTVNVRVNAFDFTPPTSNPRSFYDRTIVANTLNSVTPTFDIEWCRNIIAVISSGIATIPAVFLLQLSSDGVNWATASSSITSIASLNVLWIAMAWSVGKYARLIVTTAWTAQTLNYVHIYWN